MKKAFLLSVFLVSAYLTTADGIPRHTSPSDSTRFSELDQLYEEVSRTVREGDFEGYTATYHDDAIVVFTTGDVKKSVLISTALEKWEKDFIGAKKGITKNEVEFRFTQRVGDENSAMESGIFHYTSRDKSGGYLADAYVNFDMLLIKRNGYWLIMMEYQKSLATEADWLELK